MTVLVFLFLCLQFGKTIECSNGCETECVAEFTCLKCKIGYENDSSCLRCERNEISPKEVYLQSGTDCKKFTNIIEKDSLLPKGEIEVIGNGETKQFSINEDSYVDYGPCHFSSYKYRLSQWLYINMSSFQNNELVVVTVNRVYNKALKTDSTLYIDSTNSASGQNWNCFTRGRMANNKTVISFPVLGNDSVYFYFSVSEINSVYFEVSLSNQLDLDQISTYKLSKDMTNELYYDKNIYYSFTFNFTQQSHYRTIECIKTSMVKIGVLDIELGGQYLLNIDSTQDDKELFLIEINKDGGCENVWNGKQYGLEYLYRQKGLYVSLNASTSSNRRVFLIGSTEHLYNPTVKFKVICPDHCNSQYGNGYCSPAEGKCICHDSFGGSDCHKKCWHNNEWTIEPNQGLCYFGVSNCSEFCLCESGFVNVDHYCLNDACLNDIKDHNSNIQCLRGSRYCSQTCLCEDGYKNLSSFHCVNESCGNGELDQGEECDSVTNCNDLCECVEGYVKDPEKPNKCVAEKMKWWVYLLISFAVVVIFCAFIFVAIISSQFVSKTKRRDISVYTKQQPTYYLNISHSKNVNNIENKGEIKYRIHPHLLDFGNGSRPTRVKETRFEMIKILNRSRTKWMMVIFHTINTPKFIVYFEPQVVFMNPFQNYKRVKVCLTLNCTTKVRNTKIPYTVWFGKSKKKLEMIENILKNRTIEDWSQKDQFELESYLDDITLRYHGYLQIKTDAESSLSLDFDELDIHENPFSETHCVKNYLGFYRTVPVSIKQYCRDEYSETQWVSLKQEIERDCITLGKLRNPFIVNFIGSVSYTKDIYVITQFFVLGPLTEFIQRDSTKNVLKIPFKLKIKIMFDVAKGLQFLHYNDILHLNLKPNNILINSLFDESACCVKITDYCSSPILRNIREALHLSIFNYSAPELFDHHSYKQSDAFSFAIICWELFYQKDQFDEPFNQQQIKQRILNGSRPSFDNSIPPPLKDLIQKCWERKFDERPSFDSIVKNLTTILYGSNEWESLDVGVDTNALANFVNNKHQLFSFEMMMN